MWTIQEMKQRVGVINHTEHKQAQARPIFFQRELMNVQKNLGPTVLFPCAESEGERRRRAREGGGLEAQLLLLYPLGMLSEGWGGSVYGDVWVNWKGRKEWTVCSACLDSVYASQLYSVHCKYTLKEEHSVLQLHIENDSCMSHSWNNWARWSTLQRDCFQVD